MLVMCSINLIYATPSYMVITTLKLQVYTKIIPLHTYIHVRCIIPVSIVTCIYTVHKHCHMVAIVVHSINVNLSYVNSTKYVRICGCMVYVDVTVLDIFGNMHIL